MRKNLNDVTFLIPIRLDSINRLENLLLCTNFLLKNFHCKIIVLEASDYNNGIIKRLLNKNIDYFFVEDKDQVFHRTKYLNQMTMRVTTTYVGIWDADVIIDSHQIINSIDLLRKDIYDVVYPYDGHFYDTSDILREHFCIYKNIKYLIRNKTKMDLIYGSNTKGGAIFIVTDKYRIAGLENERFYGWGPEDFERFDRWTNFGFRITRIEGCLFHLTHLRGINSGFRNNEEGKSAAGIRHQIKASSKDEILEFLNVNNY